jgi:hypothetical protein
MTETDMASVHKFAAHALRHHLGAETTFAAFWDAYRRQRDAAYSRDYSRSLRSGR